MRLTVQGKPAGLVLPAATQTRAAFVIGAANECASAHLESSDGSEAALRWHAAKLACR